MLTYKEDGEDDESKARILTDADVSLKKALIKP
jgi:hypothetical protein